MNEPEFDHPGFLEKGIDFVLSFKDWFAAGMPWRHPDEVEELFSTHCRGGDGDPCPYYLPQQRAFIGWPKGVCGRCGCYVSNDPNSLLNMVNKPNKACPLGKWKTIIEIQTADE